MDLINLGFELIEELEGKKAENVKFMDLREVNSYLDYFIIVTGSSKMHLRSLSKVCENYMSENRMKLRAKPDLDSDWVVLDYSELVIHIFTDETRAYYNLEKLWADADFIEKEK